MEKKQSEVRLWMNVFISWVKCVYVFDWMNGDDFLKCCIISPLLFCFSLFISVVSSGPTLCCTACWDTDTKRSCMHACMCIQTLQWELRLLSDAERSLSSCLLLTASQNDLRPPSAPDCEAANGQLQQLLVFLPRGDIFIELQIKLVLFFMFFGVCGTFVVQILKVNSWGFIQLCSLWYTVSLQVPDVLFFLFVLHLHYDTIIYRLKIIQQININQSCEDSRLSLLDLSFSAFIYLFIFLGSEKSVPTAQFTAAYILSSLPAYFLVQVRWQLDFYIKIWTGVSLPDWLSSENTSVEAARFACTFPLNAGLTNSCWVVVPQRRRPAFPLALEASEA